MRLANPVHLQNPLHRSAVALGNLDQRFAALDAMMDDFCVGCLSLLRLGRCRPAGRRRGRLIVYLGDFDDGLYRSVGR